MGEVIDIPQVDADIRFRKLTRLSRWIGRNGVAPKKEAAEKLPFRTTRSMWKRLLPSTCAMIRQYDSNAAEEIEVFRNLLEEDPVVDPKKIEKVGILDNEKTSYGL